MALFNKKFYLSAYLLIACNYARTYHLNNNVISALDLTILLPKETPKTFDQQKFFEAAQKALEESIQTGEKMIEEDEKKSREELNQIFHTSKPKQHAPKKINPTQNAQRIIRRLQIEKKLTHHEAQEFVDTFSSLQESNQLKSEENKHLYNAIQNWLTTNNEGYFTEEDLEDYN